MHIIYINMIPQQNTKINLSGMTGIAKLFNLFNVLFVMLKKKKKGSFLKMY
jgi:hypothetical protein